MQLGPDMSQRAQKEKKKRKRKLDTLLAKTMATSSLICPAKMFQIDCFKNRSHCCDTVLIWETKQKKDIITKQNYELTITYRPFCKNLQYGVHKKHFTCLKFSKWKGTFKVKKMYSVMLCFGNQLEIWALEVRIRYNYAWIAIC